MVIIDKTYVYNGRDAGDSTQSINISTPNSVLLVGIGSNNAVLPTIVQFNGINLTQIVVINESNNDFAAWYVLTNPPVGTYDFFTSSPNNYGYNAIVLQNASTNISNYTVVASNNGGAAATSATTTISGFGADSLIIDFVQTANTAISLPNIEQTQLHNQNFILAFNSYNASSFIYPQSGPSTTMRWAFAGSTQYDHVIIAIPSAQAPSIWYPNLSNRNLSDVARNFAADPVPAANTFTRRGYYSPNFYLNSFLHTVGRQFGANTGGPYGIASPVQNQSSIIIDQVTQTGGSGVLSGFDFTVASSDAVVVILANWANTTPNLRFNGVPIPSLSTASFIVGANTKFAGVYYIINPPVGTSTIDDTNFSAVGLTVISLLGVNKKVKNPPIFTTSNGSGNLATLTVNPSSVNSLVLESVVTQSLSTNNRPIHTTSGQTQLTNNQSQLQATAFSVLNTGQQTLSWQIEQDPNPRWAYLAISLEPDHAYSMWSPALRERKTGDIVTANALDAVALLSSNLYQSFGNVPSQFWHNSFLHTVGRILTIPAVVVSITPGETEVPTSQIIIDKVFQGQVAAVALSTVTLNMDVNIPSPEAVLVVTGGSAIATGAQWADVNFNGTKLTNLVQAITTGADAEIWYLPNPSVGTGRLTITSGTGGEIYANAMVILGIDKSDPNIIATSTVDAASTSTITNLITPDAGNVLIIDTLATLNATQSPVADLSQTQVFNATALASNEYILTTFKIGDNSQQNTNYNLGVAVNASLVAIALRPAHAPSMWFPNIDLRSIDDVVTVAGLDSEVNPSFGSYGYKGSTFYKNSFLHTVGRMFNGGVGVITGSLTTRLLLTGVGI